jgi:hypothetical protein
MVDICPCHGYRDAEVIKLRLTCECVGIKYIKVVDGNGEGKTRASGPWTVGSKDRIQRI